MKKLLIGLVFAGLAFNSFASKEASGYVQLYANSGYIIVKLTGSNSDCGSRYYFKPDTDYNKALLSMLLSAQMADKKIWVNGSGECKATYPFSKAYQLVNMTIYKD